MAAVVSRMACACSLELWHCCGSKSDLARPTQTEAEKVLYCTCTYSTPIHCQSDTLRLAPTPGVRFRQVRLQSQGFHIVVSPAMEPQSKHACVDMSALVFELILTQDYLGWCEVVVNKLTAVSKEWYTIISDASDLLPDWSRIVQYINTINGTNKCVFCWKPFIECG